MSKRTFTPRSTVSQSSIAGSNQQLSAGIDFPDSLWWAWSGNGNVAARIQFPAPITPPAPGAGLQLVRLLLRKSADGGNAVSCDVSLYQNGVLLTPLGNVSPTGLAGEVFSFTWDASLLQTADGSLVELDIVQTNGGSGNPANRRGLEIGSLEWTYEDNIGARRLVRHRACDGSCCVAAPRWPLGAGTAEDPHQNSDCQFRLTSVDGKENHGCRIMENVVLLPNPGTPSDLKGETRDTLTMFLETCLDWPQNTDTDFDCGVCCWRWEDDV